MPDGLKNWFKENQMLMIGLIGQALIFGGYMVNLEGRVSTLETRGSPHLGIIDNRLTVLESKTESNKESIERLKDGYLKGVGK